MIDPQYIDGCLMGMAIAMAGYSVGRICKMISLHIKHMKNVKTFPNVFPLDESKMCKGPHSWYDTVLAFLKIPVRKYKVCSDCGFVCGTSFQLNVAAIMAVREARAAEELKQKREDALHIRIKQELELARMRSTNDNINKMLEVLEHREHSSEEVVKLLDKVFDDAVLVQHQITQHLKREMNGKNGSN